MRCGRRANGRPVCTWPIAVGFLFTFLILMILVLMFAPVEKGVRTVMPDFEPNAEQKEWLENRGKTKSPTTSPAPTATVVQTDDISTNDEAPSMVSEKYQFMQCEGSSECCNGNSLNCALRVNEMAFATAHNAMSTKESSAALGYNHLFDLDQALLAGYRGINLDVCKCDGKIRFCHNFCEFGAREASETLSDVVKFVTDPKYKSEVVVLIFQFSTGDPTAAELYSVMEGVDGFIDLLYDHSTTSGTAKADWPLMRDLVQNEKKRILVFQYNAPDLFMPTGIHGYFDHVADTPFEFSSAQDMRIFERTCSITRGPKEGADFYNVNAFVTPPNENEATTVNSMKFLKRRLNRCASLTGLTPNFINVDFASIGDVPELSQIRNIGLALTKQQALGR